MRIDLKWDADEFTAAMNKLAEEVARTSGSLAATVSGFNALSESLAKIDGEQLWAKLADEVAGTHARKTPCRAALPPLPTRAICFGEIPR